MNLAPLHAYKAGQKSPFSPQWRVAKRKQSLRSKNGVHEYSSNSIFSRIYFTEIYLTKLPNALISIILVHHITLCLYLQRTIYVRMFILPNHHMS